MSAPVFILCALTSLGCVWLLFQQYGRTRSRLVLWSAWCFVCLALTNLLLFVDLMLLYGLIRETT